MPESKTLVNYSLVAGILIGLVGALSSIAVYYSIDCPSSDIEGTVCTNRKIAKGFLVLSLLILVGSMIFTDGALFDASGSKMR